MLPQPTARRPYSLPHSSPPPPPHTTPSRYATHGFVVLFPFIKSPEKDKNPLTTNTNGEYILKGVEFGKAANRDPSSPLYGLIDTSNIIIAGHSMGATCSIMAGQRLAPGSVKLLITQHPGICGPFGPPPWPATWLPSDLVRPIGGGLVQ